MTILDRANAFIGHEQEVDEGLETYMRRNAFIAGFKEALGQAEEWMKEQVYQEYGGGPLERLIPNERVAEFRKSLEGE